MDSSADYCCLTGPLSICNKYIMHGQLHTPHAAFTHKHSEVIVALHPQRDEGLKGGAPEHVSVPQANMQTTADLGNNNDLYLPFGGHPNSTDWLTYRHIHSCLEVLQNTKYATSRHHTREICSVETLENHLFSAVHGPVLPSNFPEVLHQSLQSHGPCPAIIVGDHQHWRVICIDAEHKVVNYIDPLGTTFPPRIKEMLTGFCTSDPQTQWTHMQWEYNLQKDNHNCGIWAIWLIERWMQYWNLQQRQHSFAQWCTHHMTIAPSGQGLRQHYWKMMKQTQKDKQTKARSSDALHQGAMHLQQQNSFYIETQIAQFCQVHALNALFGHKAATTSNMLQFCEQHAQMM